MLLAGVLYPRSFARRATMPPWWWRRTHAAMTRDDRPHAHRARRPTSWPRASTRAASPSCWASTGRRRRASPPRSRRSRATPTTTAAAARWSSLVDAPQRPEHFWVARQRPRPRHSPTCRPRLSGQREPAPRAARAWCSARRLVDRFEVDSQAARGTRVRAGPAHPARGGRQADARRRSMPSAPSCRARAPTRWRCCTSRTAS